MSVPHLPSSPLDEAELRACRDEVGRLPITMRPALNQQLSGWSELFPYEQNRLLAFISGIRSFSPAQFETLTGPLRDIEFQMDVAHWNFSTKADTMENASMLARSPFYAEWRKQVERVFAAIESAVPPSPSGRSNSNRLILILLPESLPVSSIWGRKPWHRRGVEFRIDGPTSPVLQAAMHAALPPRQKGQEYSGPLPDSSDFWMIDADAVLGGLVLPGIPASVLDYETMRRFRDEFLAEVNTVPKDIAATDEILARIRRKEWESLWPRTLASDHRLRRFVVEVFLSGNGALIFSDAFVQWAASEAIRRARPRVLVARFGLRSKPKPFTSIAIFENQQKISAMHDEPDPQGSAVDALILARYIWLSAQRYPEGERTCCLCLSQASGSACVIAPEGSAPGWAAGATVRSDHVASWLTRLMT